MEDIPSVDMLALMALKQKKREDDLKKDMQFNEVNSDIDPHFQYHNTFYLTCPDISDQDLSKMSKYSYDFKSYVNKSTSIEAATYTQWLKNASKHCVVLWHPMMWDECRVHYEPANLHKTILGSIKFCADENYSQYGDLGIYMIHNNKTDKTPFVMFTRPPTPNLTVEHLKLEIKIIHEMCPNITNFHILAGEDFIKTKMGNSMGPLSFVRYMRQDCIDFNGKVNDDIMLDVHCITKEREKFEFCPDGITLEEKHLKMFFPDFKLLKSILFSRICSDLFV